MPGLASKYGERISNEVLKHCRPVCCLLRGWSFQGRRSMQQGSKFCFGKFAWLHQGRVEQGGGAQLGPGSHFSCSMWMHGRKGKGRSAAIATAAPSLSKR